MWATNKCQKKRAAVKSKPLLLLLFNFQHNDSGKIFVRIIISIINITRNAFCGVRTTVDETAIRRGTAKAAAA
jgi:ABC-type nitrate/sulfonate/bicarbonate transport system permease component